MNQQFGFNRFNVLPPVVKNLLIINGLFFLGSQLLISKFGLDVFNMFGLHYWQSQGFAPYQIVTHMFMHGDLGHIFFNMFSLWMFGSVIENYWGGKRFLIYYFVTGLGAAIIHNMTKAIDIHTLSGQLDPEAVALVRQEGYDLLLQGKNYMDYTLRALNDALNGPTVGASGAVYGVLLAYGMMFPNSLVYL
ncbi:MAG: rhomboid family intramembrane serine protease, partial [Bacteroidota bacterium]|nr:rhomboid family intramembrane serine protease [Bacteroidota bacterium]MDX5430231.1 rhomboid family intramembrane serine protease [Bacteroidota bacterium]MDX5468992.1 rhomboid family intramembrane serine protease [Bacteroidota bacterium]